MNVEYINSFIEASTDVINQVTGLKPKLGKVCVETTPYKRDSVAVFIGLTGRIHGRVVISFNQDIACKIASVMMGGLPITLLDEIAKSAVAELCNMILGNAMTIF
ncbi:chemotaxis protein CheX [Thermosyntropha sp.]|uniref:chemotaxis protein CheX n=1 Tax=Thermosyntropha sp. TaxID=2740820 RepID=UPI0025E0DEEF|nr:chemotaxis protein CheX [Thermosyntropha sp.]MBO8159880.1 chemotaxis protein CheX [Thermosyntropha sp.]